MDIKHDLIVYEGGKPRTIPQVQTVLTDLEDGGTCEWAPEENFTFGKAKLEYNGEHTADEHGYYGLSEVEVDVKNDLGDWNVYVDENGFPHIETEDLDLTIDENGFPDLGDLDLNEALADLDIDGNFDIFLDDMNFNLDTLDTDFELNLDTLELTETELPDEIRIMHVPDKTSYKDGEEIDLDGIIVQAYRGGEVWQNEQYVDGYIPAHELIAEIITRKAKKIPYVHNGGYWDGKQIYGYVTALSAPYTIVGTQDIDMDFFNEHAKRRVEVTASSPSDLLFVVLGNKTNAPNTVEWDYNFGLQSIGAYVHPVPENNWIRDRDFLIEGVGTGSNNPEFKVYSDKPIHMSIKSSLIGEYFEVGRPWTPNYEHEYDVETPAITFDGKSFYMTTFEFYEGTSYSAFGYFNFKEYVSYIPRNQIQSRGNALDVPQPYEGSRENSDGMYYLYTPDYGIIQISWPRPKDNRLLTASFDITVEESEGGE